MHVRKHDEQGFAMVMCVIIIVVCATLAAVVLAQSSNTERDSGRGEHWNDALQVAEAGVENSLALLEAQNGVAPAGAITGEAGHGEYTTTVEHLGRNRYRIVSKGKVGQAPYNGLQAERTIEVIMAPPVSFRYALFSLTDVDTKGNDYVYGDIWANGSVTTDNNDYVYGNIWAATGHLSMGMGSEVHGDVVTGGNDSDGVAMHLATVFGNVTAGSTSPGCVDDVGHSNYKIEDGAVRTVSGLGGNATSWGNITSLVLGTKTTHVCTDAPATKPIPSFTYNPLNYDPSTLHEFSSPTEFNEFIEFSGLHDAMEGTFYITGGGADEWVDIEGIVIAGDTTIVSMNAPISSGNNNADIEAAAGSTDNVLVLVSYYTPTENDGACTNNGGNPRDCAIGIKNGDSLNPSTALLVYAPNGPVAFKNNNVFNGAVYSNNIVMKNGQIVTYDERVDQIVGFGPVTLERESWVEL